MPEMAAILEYIDTINRNLAESLGDFETNIIDKACR